MANIKTILEINLRANSDVIVIPKDTFIEVTEDMAVYFCNEDATKQTRAKKARRTETNELNEVHLDYTYI